MPYPHYHSVRYHNPSKTRYTRIRTVKDIWGHGISVLYGILRKKIGNRKTEVQSIHFDANQFSIGEVRRIAKSANAVSAFGRPLKIETATRYRNNPAESNIPSDLPRGSVRVYDHCMEIRAIKGNDSLWPGERFKHAFYDSSKVAIYGLPNGDILLRSQIGRRLHKRFNYDR